MIHRRKGCGCGCLFLILLILIGSIGGGYWAYEQSQQGSCQGTSSGNYNVSGNTTSGDQKQIAQACYKAFTQMGWTPADACAAIGNFQYESGGLHIGAVEQGGGGGWGPARAAAGGTGSAGGGAAGGRRRRCSAGCCCGCCWMCSSA